MKSVLYTVLVVIVLFFALRLVVRYYSPQPDSLYSGEGALTACPSTPNCVASFDQSEQEHAIAPFEGESASVMKQLAEIIASQNGAKIVTQNARYLHAEYSTRGMGYIDDLELLADENGDRVHVRSASRLGKSDFGVNRNRVETLRALLETNKGG